MLVKHEPHILYSAKKFTGRSSQKGCVLARLALSLPFEAKLRGVHIVLDGEPHYHAAYNAEKQWQ
jgi:hypothetical protein